MMVNQFDYHFLGPENSEGFNYPISEEKIEILLVEKNKVIRESNQLLYYIFVNLVVAGIFYLLPNLFSVDQTFIIYGLLLIISPTIYLISKRKSRWHFIWIDFVLERNNELLLNKNPKKQKWNQMIF